MTEAQYETTRFKLVSNEQIEFVRNRSRWACQTITVHFQRTHNQDINRNACNICADSICKFVFIHKDLRHGQISRAKASKYDTNWQCVHVYIYRNQNN